MQESLDFDDHSDILINEQSIFDYWIRLEDIIIEIDEKED